MVSQSRIRMAKAIQSYLLNQEYACNINDIAKAPGIGTTRQTTASILKDIAFNGKLFKFTDQKGGGWIAIGERNSPSSPSSSSSTVEVVSSEPASSEPVKLATVTPIPIKASEKVKGIVWYASKPDPDFDPLLLAALGSSAELNEYSKGWAPDYMLKRTIGVLIRIHESLDKKAQEK